MLVILYIASMALVIAFLIMAFCELDEDKTKAAVYFSLVVLLVVCNIFAGIIDYHAPERIIETRYVSNQVENIKLQYPMNVIKHRHVYPGYSTKSEKVEYFLEEY